MPPGMDVGLRPGDFVLNWDPAPSPKGGKAPSQTFDPYLRDIVLDGDPAPLP